MEPPEATPEAIYAALVDVTADMRRQVERLAVLHEALLHTDAWSARNAAYQAHQAGLSALDALHTTQEALASAMDAPHD